MYGLYIYMGYIWVIYGLYTGYKPHPSCWECIMICLLLIVFPVMFLGGFTPTSSIMFNIPSGNLLQLAIENGDL